MSARPDAARVATLAGFGQPLELTSVPIPSPVEPGAILVKVECATICGTDVHFWQGTLNPSLDFEGAYVPGHECVGRIVEFGAGPRRDSLGRPLEVGDRIIWTGESCGQCLECSVLREPGLCWSRRAHMTLPSTEFPYLTGAFAEYGYILPRAERIKVPTAIRSEWASAASCALRTVMHAFDRLGRITPADTVLVQGDGPVGLFAVAVAKRSGARRVLAIGSHDTRLEIAKRWGADAVFPLTVPPEQRAAAIRDLSDGAGPGIVIEAAGTSAAFAEGAELARCGARYVLAGAVGTETASVAPGLLNRKQLTVLGTWSSTIEHYHQAMEFLAVARHDIDLDLLISRDYTLDTVSDALGAMAARSEIKPVVWMTDEGRQRALAARGEAHD